VIGSVFFLLVISVVPWRNDSIFSGAVDPVVIAKAVIALAALACAAALAATRKQWVPIGLGPAGTVVIVLLVSSVGAIVAGNGPATLVLVIRVLIIMVTVLLLLASASWTTCLAGLLAAMSVVAATAAATGLPTLIAEGRLGGGVPQMHPNELAGLAAPPLVGLITLMLRRGVRLWSGGAWFGLLAIVVATGSRTGLVAIAGAALVAVLVNGIRNRSVVYVLLTCLPFIYAIVLFTDIFQDLATRSGSTDTTSTLDSRFDAWRVVLAWGWTTWQKWIGLGLSVKTVPVDVKWRDEQVLDSSWVSVLAQSGLIGAILVAALVLWCVLAALISERRRRLVLPLLSLVVLRSVTESGLIDSAASFITLIVLATVLTRRSRRGDVGTANGVEFTKGDVARPDMA